MDDRAGEVPASHAERALGPFVLAFLVLGASLVATFQAWHSARGAETLALRASFDFEARRLEARILEQMAAYEQVLRGAAALFASSEVVTRGEFRSFVSALHLEESYPGIQGVGFALPVPPAGRVAHEVAVRREGFPAYAVWPEGARDRYSAIVFLEPFSGRNLRAFGYDMLSEPVRRAAMERARDTGRAALSGRVKLVQETDRDVQAGALLYLPAYRGGERGASASEPGTEFLGWVYSPFRMGDLVGGMLGERAVEVGIELHDGPEASPAALLYDSLHGTPGDARPPARFLVQRPLEIAGHRWTLVVRSLPAFEARLATGRPRLVAQVGLGGSFLLALLVFVLASGRSGALRAAHRARLDLEERRRSAEALEAARRALAASEARLRGAIAASGQVAWDHDVAAGSVAFGDGWRELTGREPVPAYPVATWAELVHPDDRAAARTRITDCLEGRAERYQAEYRIEVPGGWRWVRSQGRVTRRDEGGRPLRMSGTLADTDEIHALQERLLAATRLASVGTLAAGVAHEINNPLAWMDANLTLAIESLRAPPADEASRAARSAEVLELLGDVQQGTARIAGIVKAMRALGRPDRAGALQRVDVRAELLDAVKMIRNQLEQRAVLDLRVPETLPAVQAPTSELGRVFLNLLLNAAQAVPEGDAARHRITVSAEQAGDEVVVAVTDSGPGLPPEVRDRIFDPFFTTKPVGQGTGLGLSIARSIVEAARGRIEVVSEPGQGASFRVRLPAAAAAARETAPGGAAPGAAPGSAPRSRRRVLLVDDEPLTIRALERELAAAHEVTATSSAEEALRRLDRGERWDALLVDLIMPGLDGVGFFQALAARHPDLLPHLAFLTGGAFGQRATHFLASHDVAVMTKPIERAALLDAVERLAGGNRPAGAG